MGRIFSTVRDLARRAVSDSPGTSKLVREGRRLAMKEEGGNSLFAWPALALAKKLKGKEKVEHALYEHLHRPLKNVDEKAGRSLAKHLHAPKLFGQVDVLPTGRKMGGNRVSIEHDTHSATAPVLKASKAIAPIAASMYIGDLLSKKDQDKMASQTQEVIEDKDALLKQAADALDSAHRHVEAEKLAFEMVEKGKIPAFESYLQFHEKVAEIKTQDLRVVKAALDMNASLPDFGKTAAATSEATPAPGRSFETATAKMFSMLNGHNVADE